jgi:hypothetical protein
LKTSTEIIKWFRTSKDIEGEFKLSAMMMEKAGTGGALFRNLYRDFLKESHELLKLLNSKQDMKHLQKLLSSGHLSPFI